MFWIAVLIRMFYDLEIQTEYFIPAIFKQRVWLFAIGLVFIPMISVVKSIKKIDLDFCLKWIYRLGIIFLLFSFFHAVQGKSAGVRLDENRALNSISFGLSSAMIATIALYQLINKSTLRFLDKIIHISVMLLGFYIVLRTGSKGPIVAVLIVLYFWYSFKDKRIFKGLIKFSILTTLTIVSKNVIIKAISIVSPISADRINNALSGNDASTLYRLESYSWFINKIKGSPIWGSHFARLANGEYPGYAHNIFLDILLGFGILGLSAFLYIIFKALRNLHLGIIHKNKYWVGLIMILFFTISLSSGAYYSNPELNISIVLTLIYHQTIDNKFSNNLVIQ